jgi:S1-C subfamily serine protease
MKDINDIKVTSIKNEEPREDAREKERNEKMEEFLAESNRQSANPIFIPTEGQYKPRGMMKIVSYLGMFIVIFLVGGIGGVWMDQSVMPKLAGKEPFKNYAFFKAIGERTSIINNTNNVIISDDSALLESIRKVSPSVVKITANYVFQEKPPIKKKANAPALKTTIENRNLSGVIITSDGLVLTRDPQNFKIDLAKNDFTEVNYTVTYGANEYTVSGVENITFYDAVDKSVKGTEKGNLVILKIKAENLPVIALGDSTNAEIGQKAVALGNSAFSGIISERAIGGILSIDNTPSSAYFGSGPLIDSKGKMMGINIINGKDMATGSFIGVDEFKDFIKQVIGS